jgi:hypothetical protein
MGKIKGNAFLTYIDYFKDKFGPDAINIIKATMSAEDSSQLFNKKILTVSWIEYSTHIRFLLAADKIFGSGDGQVILDGGRWCARKDFSGMYKIFIAVASPMFLLKKVPNMWRTFYNSGSMQAEALSDTHIQLVLTDFPNIPEKHELEQLYYFEEILLMAKAKKAKATHPKCMARGDEQCIFDIIWE